VAQKNQFSTADFQKITLAMNPNNANDLLNSKKLEGIIKSIIAATQQEGQKVLHSQRSYDENGMRMTDFYAPKQFATSAWNAASVHLDALRQSVNTDMSVSAPIDTPFRSQKVSILNPSKRSELARLVTANGGFFDTNKSGMTTMGMDKSIKVGGKNLSSSVIAQVARSNLDHKNSWEDIMLKASGYEHSFSDYSPLERSIKAAAAKRTLVGRQSREYSAVDEKEATYARLRKRGNAFKHTAEYAKEHPDDPFVKARRMVEAKRRTGKVTGAARFAKGVMLGTLTGILGFAAASVGILNKISDVLGGIGSAVRAQRMTDAKYNFADNTNRLWQSFAAAKGYDKDTLSVAAEGIMQAWNNPMQYKGANFATLAPLLKGKTSDLVKMSAKDGKSILQINDAVLNDYMEASAAGITATHPEGGVSPEQAYAQNLQLLSSHNAKWGEELQDMWTDFTAETPSGKLGDWKKTDINGVDQVMNATRYRTQVEWAKEYAANKQFTGSDTKQGAEDTFSEIAKSKAVLSSAAETLLQKIAASSQQLVDDFTSFAISILDKFGLAPETVNAYNEASKASNAKAYSLVSAIMPAEKKDLDARLKAAGLPDADTLLKSKDPSAAYGQKYNDFIGDTANAASLARYMNTVGAKAKIEEQTRNGINGKLVTPIAFTATTHGTGTGSQLSKLKKAAADSVSKMLFSAAVPMLQDEDVLWLLDQGVSETDIDAALQKQYASHMSDASNKGLSYIARRNAFKDTKADLSNMLMLHGVTGQKDASTTDAAKLRNLITGSVGDEYYSGDSKSRATDLAALDAMLNLSGSAVIQQSTIKSAAEDAARTQALQDRIREETTFNSIISGGLSITGTTKGSRATIKSVGDFFGMYPGGSISYAPTGGPGQSEVNINLLNSKGELVGNTKLRGMGETTSFTVQDPASITQATVSKSIDAATSSLQPTASATPAKKWY